MPSLREALSKYSTVIVTGGSSGIGKTFIKRIHSLAPDVCFCNISRRLPQTDEVELNLHHFACDLSVPANLALTADKVLDFLQNAAPQGPMLLINNSGFGGYGGFNQIDCNHQLEMIDLNVRAMVDLTARLMPVLQKRGGAVINVGSAAGFQPTPYMATYGATKAFVLNWSLALGEELRSSGVGVLAVCPGPTSTDFAIRAGIKPGSIDDGWGQTAEQVVDKSLVALTRGKALVVTGWKNKLITAFSSRLPKILTTRLAAKAIGRYRASKVAPQDNE